MLAKITVDNSFNRIRIKINGIIHLSLPQEDVRCQSWLVPSKSYYAIEYYTPTGEILCEYDSKDTWQSILVELEKHKII